MSLSLVYRPLTSKIYLSHSSGAPNALKDKLERVFGVLPKVFDSSDIERLQVAALLEPEERLWQNIVDAIQTYNEIEILIEW